MRRLERLESPIAREERALNFTELTQEFTDARFGFHFEDWQMGSTSNLRRLTGRATTREEADLRRNRIVRFVEARDTRLGVCRGAWR